MDKRKNLLNFKDINKQNLQKQLNELNREKQLLAKEKESTMDKRKNLLNFKDINKLESKGNNTSGNVMKILSDDEGGSKQQTEILDPNHINVKVEDNCQTQHEESKQGNHTILESHQAENE